MDRFILEFKSPGVKWRGKPFWSWNGQLEKEELLRQIDIMKEMGMGGYFMHSRTGLKTEYLGEEWFACIDACVEKGMKEGLESWLYDEDRWPSGTCGGIVTRKKEYRAKFIQGSVIKYNKFIKEPERYLKSGGTLFLKTLALFYAELRRYTLGNYEQISIDNLSKLPEKREGWVFLVFTVEEEPSRTFYNGSTWVDTLNLEATNYYLQTTHEEYKKRCGDYFGKGIEGNFTDEPNRGTVFDRFNLRDKNTKWMVPYNEKIFGLYDELFSENLLDKLPELYFWKDKKKLSPVKWRYMEVLQRLFLENYAIPIYEWHEKNGLKLTGHILHEDSLGAQTAVCGSVMRYYPYMHYPGVDILTEDNRNYHVVKQLSSVARQNGQKWLLSELYGCTGWQFNFEAHKWVGDWQTLFGINLRCHHLSWYTMEGEAKRDFPASILHQSAWYKDYSIVESYFARLGLVLSQGKPICELLIINPVESIWAQIYPGSITGLSSRDRDFKIIEKQYMELFHWLIGSGFDFDYGDEGLMKELSHIEVEDGQPYLYVGESRYKAVIIGGLKTIRSETLHILSKFAEVGGKIIFAGEPPELVDVIPSPLAIQLSKQSLVCKWDKNELLSTISFLPSIKIIDLENGRRTEDIFLQQRKDGNVEYLILMNMNRKKSYPKIKIHWQHQSPLVELDLLTGDMRKFQGMDNGDHFICNLSESGSLAIASGFKGEILSKAQNKKARVPKITNKQKIPGPYDYELEEDNICVLDYVSWKINNSSSWYRDDILKADIKIREEFGLERRKGDMVQPWYRRKFHLEEVQKKYGKVTFRYEFCIETKPSKDIVLAVESPDVWTITMNGNPLLYEKQNGFWIDIAFKRIIVPTSLLNLGKNIIELETDFTEETNPEAIYLIGDFAVRLKGRKRILGTLPSKLEVGSITEQGLPFYSAGIKYILPVTNDIPSGIVIPKYEGACIAVTDGTGRRIIPWPPYEVMLQLNGQNHIILEIILTRRNTFGPLHQIPLRAQSYGHNNFVTSGPFWKDECNLLPSGLLDQPVYFYSS